MSESHPKKVRSACQRCRLRRVKCDGSFPACGNCSRAGARCVDVDSNSDLLVPRSFLINGPARIRWLEDVIRTQLPTFDLSQGPQVDALPFSEDGTEDSRLPGVVRSPAVGGAASAETGDPFGVIVSSVPAPASSSSAHALDSVGTALPSTPQALTPTTGGPTPKRTSSQISADNDRPLRDEVRSVAIDLRLLSLNADSRQKHYLGSSSGMVFTRIIGVDEPAAATPTAGSATAASSSSAGMANAAASVGGAPYNNTGRLPRHLNHHDGPANLSHDSMPPPRQGVRMPTPRSRGAILQRKAERQNLQMLHRHLQQDLPSRDETYSLLEVYFSELHRDHPILHAPSLLRAVEALYDSVDLGPGTPVNRHGWPESVKPFSYNGDWGLDADHADQPDAADSDADTSTPISIYTAAAHVFLVLSLAATVRTRGKDFDISPTRLYRAAMACAGECFSTISLASLQCLLLLSVRALLSPAEVNIWTLIHVAMAHCIDLGIHREAVVAASGSDVAVHVRRTVFYAAYTLERSIAAIQGRPVSVRDDTFDVAMPEANPPSDYGASTVSATTTTTSWSEEDMDAGAVIIHLAAQSLPYSLHDFKFQRIVSDIKNGLYLLPPSSPRTQQEARGGEAQGRATAAPTTPNATEEAEEEDEEDISWWPRDPYRCQQKLRRRLEEWHRAIPGVVAAAAPPNSHEATRLRLKLEQRYHQAMVLLHQPSQAIRQPSPEALGVCFTHAAARVRGYEALYAQDNLYLNWRTVQGILSSGTIMIACFWAATAFPGTVSPPPSDHDTTATTEASGHHPGLALYGELAKDLRTCSGLLSASGEWWPSAKRSKDGFERMVDQTLRRHAQVMQAWSSAGGSATTTTADQDQARFAASEARAAKMPRLSSDHGGHGGGFWASAPPPPPPAPGHPASSPSLAGGMAVGEGGGQDDANLVLNALVDMREQQQPSRQYPAHHQQPAQRGMYGLDVLNMTPPVESFASLLDHNDPSWDLFGSIPVMNWFDASINQ